MKHLLPILAALCLLSSPAAAQQLKSLMYNTTNGYVAYSGTNTLTFTNSVDLQSPITIYGVSPITFDDGEAAELTRANLGFSTNLAFLWSATNQDQARSALGLGNGSEPDFFMSMTLVEDTNSFTVSAVAGVNRTNLGLGSSNIVTFAGLTNNGDIRINQTTTNNGLLYIYRTNNEPFLGLANLIASNNTTISNETLFRVGVAEATNRSAQFGFRSTNTNGNGVAVFSVFGFNALMQIGADASTNAVIYSGGGTNNEVMTLIRDGATEFARPLRFSTNAASKPATNAPANTTNVAAWVEMQIGTNSYRLPLYQ